MKNLPHIFLLGIFVSFHPGIDSFAQSLNLHFIANDPSIPGESDGSINLGVTGGVLLGSSELVVVIETDDFGSETTWDITENSSGNVLMSGGPYGPDGTPSTFMDTVNLAGGTFVTFNIYDSFGDGICCAFPLNGSWTLFMNNMQIGTGGEFGFYESYAFTAQGMNNDYDYIWSNGATTQDLAGLASGIYSVTVTDDLGATVSGSDTLLDQIIACDTIDAIYVSNITPTSARLIWTSVPNAHHYRIQGRRIGSPNWVEIVAPGLQGFMNVSGLTFGSSYEWQVKAFCDQNEINESIWSEMDTFTTSCQTPDSAWTANVSSNGAILAWNQVPGSAGYEIKGRGAGGSGWLSILVGSSTTSKSVFGLNPATTYEWTVRTWCHSSGAWQSDFTPILSFTTSSALRMEFDDEQLDSQNSNLEMKIYPNPVSDYFYVEIAGFEKPERIEFFNLNGQLVKAVESVASDGKLLVPTEGIFTGVYLVKFTSGFITRSTRIVIQ